MSADCGGWTCRDWGGIGFRCKEGGGLPVIICL
jgi:hypothetical protein